MSPKGFAVLAAATALSLGLAAWAVTARDVPLAASRQAEPMFAGLLDRLNDVQTIKVTGGGQTLTMTRTADGKWQLAERGGYPADYKKARELALGLASLQLVEAKTAKADRLARLELGDPAKPDAKSHQVDLLDKDGKTLATAIVGKTKYGLYGGGRSGVYVRRGGEDQAWLAAGELSVPSSPTDVVSRDIIDIPQDEIGRVTLGADGPAPIVAAKADRNAPSYALEPPPPEGRKADEEKVNRLAGTLSSLTMQDVKPIAEVTFPPDAPKARFETWDGIDVDVRAATTGDGDKAEHWMSFTVAAGEPLAPAPVPAEGQPAPKPAPERAAELKSRLDGWAFKLSEYMAGRIGWKMYDLLAAAEGQS
jgi:hypothetical protein